MKITPDLDRAHCCTVHGQGAANHNLVTVTKSIETCWNSRANSLCWLLYYFTLQYSYCRKNRAELNRAVYEFLSLAVLKTFQAAQKFSTWVVWIYGDINSKTEQLSRLEVEKDNWLRLQCDVKSNDHWVSFLGNHSNLQSFSLEIKV